eukprot:g2548.t1
MDTPKRPKNVYGETFQEKEFGERTFQSQAQRIKWSVTEKDLEKIDLFEISWIPVEGGFMDDVAKEGLWRIVVIEPSQLHLPKMEEHNLDAFPNSSTDPKRSVVSDVSLEWVFEDLEVSGEVYFHHAENRIWAGIQPATQLKVRLRSRNPAGWSDYSSIFQYVTSDASPGTPTLPEILSFSAVTVTLRWEEPPSHSAIRSRQTDVYLRGQIEEYEIEFLEENIHDEEVQKASERAVATGGIHRQSQRSRAIVDKWVGGTFIGNKESEILREISNNQKPQSVKAKDRFCVFTDLEPSKCYRFRVRARNTIDGWGPFSFPSKLVKTEHAPFIAARTSRSITMQWFKFHSGDTRYELQQQTGEIGSWETLSSTITETTFTATSLIPASIYRYRVRSFNDRDEFHTWKGCAASYYVKTSDEEPEKCLGVRSRSISAHEIEIVWDKPCGNGQAILEYEASVLQCSLDPHSTHLSLSKEWIPYPETWSKTRGIIKNLQPGTSYQFCVRAANSIGFGARGTPSEEIRTTNDIPDCTQIEIFDVQDTSVKLIWRQQRTNGTPILNFQLQHRELDSFSLEGKANIDDELYPWLTSKSSVNPIEVQKLFADLGDNDAQEIKGGEILPTQKSILQKSLEEDGIKTVFTCGIENLLPGRNYHFRLRCRNDVGFNGWIVSDIVTTTPSVPAAVSKLYVDFCDITSTTLKLQWPIPKNNGAEIECYQIEQRIYSEELERSEEGKPGTDDHQWKRIGSNIKPAKMSIGWTTHAIHSHVCDGLLAGTNYQFRIRSRNARGWSPFNDIVEKQELQATSKKSYLQVPLCCFRTAPCEPDTPTGIVLSLVKGEEQPKASSDYSFKSRLHLSWNIPRDNGSAIELYEVSAKLLVESGDEQDVCNTGVSLEWINYEPFNLELGAEQNFILENLLPGMHYIARIRAWNDFGWSEYSVSSKPLRTSTAPPAKPVPPRFSNVSCRSIGLVILPPRANGEELLGLQMWVQPIDEKTCLIQRPKCDDPAVWLDRVLICFGKKRKASIGTGTSEGNNGGDVIAATKASPWWKSSLRLKDLLCKSIEESEVYHGIDVVSEGEERLIDRNKFTKSRLGTADSRLDQFYVGEEPYQNGIEGGIVRSAFQSENRNIIAGSDRVSEEYGWKKIHEMNLSNMSYDAFRKGLVLSISDFVRPFSMYRFAFRCSNKWGNGLFSDPSNIVRTSVSQPCVPSQVTIEKVTDSLCFVSWTCEVDETVDSTIHNGSLIDKYELHFRQRKASEYLKGDGRIFDRDEDRDFLDDESNSFNSSSWVKISDEIVEQKFMVRNLQPVMDYWFRVRAHNASGWGLFGKQSKLVRTKRRL